MLRFLRVVFFASFQLLLLGLISVLQGSICIAEVTFYGSCDGALGYTTAATDIAYIDNKISFKLKSEKYATAAQSYGYNIVIKGSYGCNIIQDKDEKSALMQSVQVVSAFSIFTNHPFGMLEIGHGISPYFMLKADDIADNPLLRVDDVLENIYPQDQRNVSVNLMYTSGLWSDQLQNAKYRHRDTRFASKVTYITPPELPFIMGFAYIPDTRASIIISNSSNKNAPSFQNVLQYSIAHMMNVQDLYYKFSLGIESGSATEAIRDLFDDLWSCNAGCKISYLGWEIDGGYGCHNVTKKSLEKSLNHYYTVGIGYHLGSLHASISHFQSSDKNSALLKNSFIISSRMSDMLRIYGEISYYALQLDNNSPKGEFFISTGLKLVF